MRTDDPRYARSEHHTQLANMSFDKIFDLTAGVYARFFNVYFCVVHPFLEVLINHIHIHVFLCNACDKCTASVYSDLLLM